jgi:hypothetical protein
LGRLCSHIGERVIDQRRDASGRFDLGCDLDLDLRRVLDLRAQALRVML